MGVIRRNLSEIAGVNTSMNLDFEHVTVDTDPTWSGADVFDYVVVDDGMASPASRTTILWPNSTRTFENQTDDWNDDFRLNFNIGTIKVKQSWETTFRFKVKKEGVIDLFGPGSTISYNDMPGSLHLPTTLITSINNTVPVGLQSGSLDVSNLAKSGPVTNFLPLRWNLEYTGSSNATETMWYSRDNGPWIQFDTHTGIAPNTLSVPVYTHTGMLDVRKLSYGTYRIKVHAIAPDSPDDEDIIGAIVISNAGVLHQTGVIPFFQTLFSARIIIIPGLSRHRTICTDRLNPWTNAHQFRIIVFLSFNPMYAVFWL